MTKKKTDFAAILKLMEAQFGHIAKSFWVYDGAKCPCCLEGSIDGMVYNGERAESLNFFMYRDRGVLIAYPLCQKCALEVMTYSPDRPAPAHQKIEVNLIGAYLRHLNTLS